MKKEINLNHKYNKVNQQQKYHLLNLIYKYKNNVRQAAQTVGINYLTAKTIVFFHKNQYKSYQFTIENIQKKDKYPIMATYSYIRKINTISEHLIKPKSRIQVICSIGNILNPSSHQGDHIVHDIPILIERQLQQSQNDSNDHDKQLSSIMPEIYIFEINSCELIQKRDQNQQDSIKEIGKELRDQN